MPESTGSRRTHDIGFALGEPHAARRAFDRAARTLDAASFMHDRARAILCERLDMLPIDPRVVVDLGCGTGSSTHALLDRFPQAHVLGVDWSRAMCRAMAQRCPGAAALAADAVQLPFGEATVDLMFSNLMLPSCRPDRVFAEIARVLKSGGLFLFASLGPATLAELREAWRQVDSEIHVHAAFEPQVVGDWLAAAGLVEPVVDVDRVALKYADVARIHADLRAIGATNVARGRRRGLTGAQRFRRYVEALAATAVDGSITVTCELILGVAWGGERAAKRRATPRWQAVPVDSIKRRSLS